LEIKLSIFGFGDDRPLQFGNRNHILLSIEPPVSPQTVIQQAGFEESENLVLMINNRVVSRQDWDNISVTDEDDLRLLSAFEGG